MTIMIAKHECDVGPAAARGGLRVMHYDDTLCDADYMRDDHAHAHD